MEISTEAGNLPFSRRASTRNHEWETSSLCASDSIVWFCSIMLRQQHWAAQEIACTCLLEFKHSDHFSNGWLIQYICYRMRLNQWIIFLIIWDCYNILRAMRAVSCFCCMLGFCRATETAVTDQSSDPGLILEPAIKNLLDVANRSACVIAVNFNGRFIL